MTARAMFGCFPGAMPSTGMVRTDRPMDPAKDVLVVFWGRNEIMTWNEREQANTALPYRELPAELVKSMRRMVRMMKRFPRSLIFVGDNPEVPMGRDYNSWITEACSKFRELGMPCVFDASRLFYGWPRADDLRRTTTCDR